MAKIFIVEDDTSIATLYKNRLTQDGYEAEVIQDVDAVKRIIEGKPDLVLLDIMMPNVSGIKILAEIRQNDATSFTPVLVLTNVEQAQEMEQAIKLGAEGYILKAETSLDSLASQVKRSLEEKASAQTAQQ